MPDRTEFGLRRSVCACSNCVLNCRFIPGFLIPSDLEGIARATGGGNGDLTGWAMEHLLASPGAVVERHGVLFRIPTLVPNRRLDGGCHWLTADNHCAIHAVAPYACAFFDAHMPYEEVDRRSRQGLIAICHAWNADGPYARLWRALKASGRIAPSAETCRAAMRNELNRKS